MEVNHNTTMNKPAYEEHLCLALKIGNLERLKEHIPRLIKERGRKKLNYVLDDRSMLHIASFYGHMDIVEFLVRNGANVNKMDNLCFTPLLCALWKKHLKVAKYLISKGAITRYRTLDGRRYFECTDNPEMIRLLKQIANR